MTINPSIFKSYDIRGIYPADINRDVVYKIGRAFAKKLARDEDKSPGELHILAGHDMRTSSPELFEALLGGMVSTGASVFDAELIAIDQMYFGLGRRGYDGGAMVTASHNPKEYNGLKLYKKGVQMMASDEIKALREAAENDDGQMAHPRGNITRVSFDDDYAKTVLSLVKIDAIKPLSVVLDAGNGMAGRIFPLVLANVPQIKHTDLYFEPDGTFPNHEANPEKLENTREIQKKVVEMKADFGAAFDGDADRIVLIDDTGEVLRGDIITGMLAARFLERYKGSPIVFNSLCTNAVRDIIEKHGGKPVVWKTGHTNMKAKMREVGAVFGGEMSGHLFFKDFYNAESATLAFLMMAELVSTSGKKLSELAQELKTYSHWSRYVYLDVEPPEAIKRVREAYEKKAAKTDEIDGLTFFFNDPWWWFNIRASNTEPRISLTIESKDRSFTENMRSEILSLTGGKVAGDA